MTHSRKGYSVEYIIQESTPHGPADAPSKVRVSHRNQCAQKIVPLAKYGNRTLSQIPKDEVLRGVLDLAEVERATDVVGKKILYIHQKRAVPTSCARSQRLACAKHGRVAKAGPAAAY